jgi:hypothetical protein
MSDSWDRLHRRHRLVHAVLYEIGRTGRPAVAAKFRADVDAEFGDFGGFLAEVQRRWYRAFDARLDALLEHEPDELEPAVADIWAALADRMPATRLLLDTHTGHPALRELHAHHRRNLRAALGAHHPPGRNDDRTAPRAWPLATTQTRRPSNECGDRTA